MPLVSFAYDCNRWSSPFFSTGTTPPLSLCSPPQVSDPPPLLFTHPPSLNNQQQPASRSNPLTLPLLVVKKGMTSFLSLIRSYPLRFSALLAPPQPLVGLCSLPAITQHLCGSHCEQIRPPPHLPLLPHSLLLRKRGWVARRVR